MVYIPYDVDLAVKSKCKRYHYSNQTAKAYLYWIHRFLNWSKKELGKISKKDVSAFLQKLDNNNLSGNTLNQAHMAIKFLFEDVMNRKMWINIKYTKVPKKIQRVLTKQEVKILLDNIKNNKHRLMIELMYSAGLRVSEIVNMKVENLVWVNGKLVNYGFIRNGKGGKDRLFIIANHINNKLQKLIDKEKLEKEDYLFLTNRGKRYNIRSLQQIVKKSVKSAEIENWQEIHCHTLRHSFATHLIEQGTSIGEVQSILGHKNPETSLGYI
ncbi:MAG: tyrosine-type recombinase/integrase, partial [Candidatus Nanoarchaeia archaeon]